MNTAIIITAIICGTIIVISILNTIDKAITTKKASKSFKDFSDNFFKEEK